jgi:hypothetical protein
MPSWKSVRLGDHHTQYSDDEERRESGVMESRNLEITVGK